MVPLGQLSQYKNGTCKKFSNTNDVLGERLKRQVVIYTTICVINLSYAAKLYYLTQHFDYFGMVKQEEKPRFVLNITDVLNRIFNDSYSLTKQPLLFARNKFQLKSTYPIMSFHRQLSK